MMTPFFTALSSCEMALRRASTEGVDVARLARNFFSEFLTLERTMLLRAFLRALLRMRRAADFVFGIVSFSKRGAHPSE